MGGYGSGRVVRTVDGDHALGGVAGLFGRRHEVAPLVGGHHDPIDHRLVALVLHVATSTVLERTKAIRKRREREKRAVWP